MRLEITPKIQTRIDQLLRLKELGATTAAHELSAEMRADLIGRSYREIDWKVVKKSCPACNHRGPVDPDFGFRTDVIRQQIDPQSYCAATRASLNYHGIPRKNATRNARPSPRRPGALDTTVSRRRRS
jgi:hypothetical protein